MVIAAVDPNKKDLKLLVKYLYMVYPNSQVVMFCSPKDASEFMRNNPIDVLFTEVEMTGMTGFGLQEFVKAVQPAVFTVFVTGTNNYAREALRARAAGYVLKPVTKESIQESLRGTKFCYTKMINH